MALLAVMIFPVPEEAPLRPMERRPPGFLATRDVAPDREVAAARGPGSGTVARFPGDLDSARPPRMVKAALRRPWHTTHLASRT